MRWTMADEMNELECGLNIIKWNITNEVQAEENEMKHEQEIDYPTFLFFSLSLTILLGG